MYLMKTETNGLSVIIVNFNGSEYINTTLESLIRAFEEEGLLHHEILIIDNNSSDNSTSLIKNFISDNPKIKLFESDENHGFGIGNNRLIKHAQYNHLLLINNDTETLSLKKTAEYVKQGKISNNQIFSCRIFNRDYTRQQNTFGKPGVLKLIIDLFLLKRIAKKIIGSIDSELNYFYFSGCFLLMRTALFKRVNGFDERFTFYHEEADFFIRLGNNVERLLLDDRIIHYGGGGGQMTDFAFIHYYIGLFKLFLYNKLSPKWLLIWLYRLGFNWRKFLVSLGITIRYQPIDMYKESLSNRTNKEIKELHNKVLTMIGKDL